MWVKICGCRTPAGVEAAIAAGADAIGFIFAESGRRVGVAEAARLARGVPSGVAVVGVLRSPTLGDIRRLQESLRLDMVQVSGRMPPGDPGLPVLRTIYLGAGDRLPPGPLPRADLLHLDRRQGDRFGGSGLPVGRQAARRIASQRKTVLAGGLTPETVAQAILAVEPFGVDVASGVETAGQQDPLRIRAFVRQARGALG